MPNFVQERNDSPGRDRNFNGDTADLKYNVYGMTDPDVAHAALIAGAPATVTAIDSGRTLVPVSYRIEGQIDNYWIGSVRYEEPAKQPKQRPETNETRRSFRVSLTTKHVEKSLETTATATFEHGTNENFNQLVGVTQDRVEGADILVPEFTHQVTKYVPSATVTDAWVHQVADLVGTVNDAAFRSFAKGEVLLTGVSGADRSETDVELSFEFARNKNGTVTIPGLEYLPPGGGPGDWTSAIPKLGWEYLWVYYTPAKGTKHVVRVPRFAYVERMYEFGDFSLLGL